MGNNCAVLQYLRSCASLAEAFRAALVARIDGRAKRSRLWRSDAANLVVARLRASARNSPWSRNGRGKSLIVAPTCESDTSENFYGILKLIPKPADRYAVGWEFRPGLVESVIGLASSRIERSPSVDGGSMGRA